MAEQPGQKNRDAPSNKDKARRGLLIGFAIAGAILLVVILWVWVNPSDPPEKKDFIQAVGVLLAALAGLGGLYFTSQNIKQTRKNNEEQLRQARDSTEKQLRQAHESQEQTQRLVEQGQITERFTRAIEQLGATDDKGKKSLERRLGGIYALERIAKESKKDYWPIIEILTAYVRENAPRKQEELGEKAHPDLDIQAILTVLGRNFYLWNHPDAEGEVHRLIPTDLSKTHLRGADFTGANLDSPDFHEADLREAIFHRFGTLSHMGLIGSADFRGADLRGADFQVANLSQADLTGAILWGANLQGAEHLTQDQIEWAMGSNGTKLPENLNRPEWWSRSTEEQAKILQERLYGAH